MVNRKRESRRDARVALKSSTEVSLEPHVLNACSDVAAHQLENRRLLCADSQRSLGRRRASDKEHVGGCHQPTPTVTKVACSVALGMTKASLARSAVTEGIAGRAPSHSSCKLTVGR